MKKILKGNLFDQSGVSDKKVPIEVEICNGTLYISPKGYGDCTSKDECGYPIAVEIWEGELRVIVWSDINKEDPINIISLEGAREDKRIEDHNKAMASQDDN